MSELKAYKVGEDSEGGQVVVFATSGAAARRMGGDELNLSFQEVDSCCRAPVFDEFAPGPVPLLALIDAGWWHECAGCSEKISSDGERIDHDGDWQRMEPIERGRSLYCCAACMAQDDAATRRRDARESALVDFLEVRFPGVIKFTHLWAGYAEDAALEGAQATMLLPGLAHDVQWRNEGKDGPWCYCARDEVETFKALYGQKEG